LWKYLVSIMIYENLLGISDTRERGSGRAAMTDCWASFTVPRGTQHGNRTSQYTSIGRMGAGQPLLAEVAALGEGLRRQVGLREVLIRHERRAWAGVTETNRSTGHDAQKFYVLTPQWCDITPSPHNQSARRGKSGK